MAPHCWAHSSGQCSGGTALQQAAGNSPDFPRELMAWKSAVHLLNLHATTTEPNFLHKVVSWNPSTKASEKTTALFRNDPFLFLTAESSWNLISQTFSNMNKICLEFEFRHQSRPALWSASGKKLFIFSLIFSTWVTPAKCVQHKKLRERNKDWG